MLSLGIEGSILLFTSSGLRLQALHVLRNSGLLLRHRNLNSSYSTISVILVPNYDNPTWVP